MTGDEISESVYLDGKHTPIVVYFDRWKVRTPAEVCATCSDPWDGKWVPASFCDEATAKMNGEERNI